MWIDTLSLRNFRGFRELDLDLRRQLTVLIGVNGSGKSTIVDALEAVSMFWGGPLKQFLARSDIRVGETSLSVQVRGPSIHWFRFSATESVRDLVRSPTDHTGAWEQRVLCMRTSRTRVLLEGSETRSGVGYEGAEQWFRWREDLENEVRVRTRDLDAEDVALALVRRALKALIPGLANVHVERGDSPGRSSLVFEKAGRPFSADMLSDGEKSLVALGVEISRFLASFREEVALAERQATIVIDEIELHLHPKWQRVVVPRLLAAFPNCQFIITTHSPQVIGSVDVENLFILEDFKVRPASLPTKGRDSNAILEEIMGATARDPDTETELDQAARLVEVGSDEDAEAAVQKLADRFGEDDREVVRLRTALLLRGA